jgi:hypothetical protein
MAVLCNPQFSLLLFFALFRPVASLWRVFFALIAALIFEIRAVRKGYKFSTNSTPGGDRAITEASGRPASGLLAGIVASVI